MRAATAADAPAIAARLAAQVERAMFPLANLARHGMAGGHPRAMRFWVAGDPVEDVLGVTEEGMVLPLLDPALAADAARAMAGLRVIGMAGESAQVRALMAAAGLDTAPAQMNHDEPHFTLSLDRLEMPGTEGLALVPIGAADRDLMIRWCVAYDTEALGSDPARAAARAEGELDNWIRADSHRVLLKDGQPVARTGFNARLPDIVQVGAVYTPPSLRGQGHARRAVALHLVEERDAGATRATLFSASDMAARAYRALGFREIGRFTLVLFHDPQEVRPV